jgi:hypothetical protein
MHAFYRGVKDARSGGGANPYRDGTEEARCWENGRMYAEDEK